GIAEGLLICLGRDAVAALARDPAAMPGARAWLIDLASPRLLEWLSRGWARATRGAAPFRFAPPEGTRFFDAQGWREAEFRGTLDEARRAKRAATDAGRLPRVGQAAPGHRQ